MAYAEAGPQASPHQQPVQLPQGNLDDPRLGSAGNPKFPQGNLDDPKLDAEDSATIALGRDALKSLGKTWESYWLPIGAAVIIGRRFCMRITQSKKPEGSAFNGAFSGWLKTNGFPEETKDPKVPVLRKKERAFVLRCMEYQTEITIWRTKLSETQCREWNHPRTVWQKFSKTSPEAVAAYPASEKTPAEDKKKTNIREELAKAHAEIDTQRAELKKSVSERVLGPTLSPEEMAKRVLAHNPGLAGIPSKKFDAFVEILRGLRTNAAAKERMGETKDVDDDESEPPRNTTPGQPTFNRPQPAKPKTKADALAAYKNGLATGPKPKRVLQVKSPKANDMAAVSPSQKQ